MLVWFERLHAFFERQTGLNLDRRAPVRVLIFSSVAQYERLRLRPNNDAYYLSTNNGDYIVLSSPQAETVAAHEYWHFIEHAEGLRLPAALKEGLAEFFSTVQIGPDRARIGAVPPARFHILQTHPWTPLLTLLSTDDLNLGLDRQAAGLFYSEAWALCHMLMLAPDYAEHFRELVERISAGGPVKSVMEATYAKPLSTIAADLREWVSKRSLVAAPLEISISSVLEAPIVEDTDDVSVRFSIAEILSGSGRVDEAEEIYRHLEREAPKNAEISAAHALLALQRKEIQKARLLWKQALESGIRDARTCYSFALFGEAAGMSEAEIRPALECAIASHNPSDDALFRLALIENASGERQTALGYLRAMREVIPERRYSYWMAVSDILNDSGHRDEARTAAERAKEWAATREQRNAAEQLAYMAETDLGVRFARDSSGNTRMETARVPHNSSDWNPFVEAGDRVRHIKGRLREIECSDARSVFVIESSAEVVKISIADPTRVQMTNAPAEFTCGPQDGALVTAVYAETGDSIGLLRGMQFW